MAKAPVYVTKKEFNAFVKSVKKMIKDAIQKTNKPKKNTVKKAIKKA